MSDYATIRDCIGEFIGKTLVEMTQHDKEHFLESGEAFVDLMFDSVDVLRFYTQPGRCIAVNPGHDDGEELDLE